MGVKLFEEVKIVQVGQTSFGHRGFRITTCSLVWMNPRIFSNIPDTHMNPLCKENKIQHEQAKKESSRWKQNRIKQQKNNK